MTKLSLEYLMWFLNEHKDLIHGRIADYGGTENVGLTLVKDSLAAGGQTDYHALDFDNGVDLREPIPGPKYDVGICMDLLEHTSNPFVVAKNIKDSLAPGALLFVTVPYIWELHYYPKDYWRFTPQGVEELFSDMYVEIIGLVRDADPDEDVPRHRIIAIFRNQPKQKKLTIVNDTLIMGPEHIINLPDKATLSNNPHEQKEDNRKGRLGKGTARRAKRGR